VGKFWEIKRRIMRMKMGDVADKANINKNTSSEFKYKNLSVEV